MSNESAGPVSAEEAGGLACYHRECLQKEDAVERSTFQQALDALRALSCEDALAVLHHRIMDDDVASRFFFAAYYGNSRCVRGSSKGEAWATQLIHALYDLIAANRPEEN